MVRPQRDRSCGVAGCIEPAGGSPAAVSLPGRRVAGCGRRARARRPSAASRALGGSYGLRRRGAKLRAQCESVNSTASRDGTRKGGWPSRSCHGEGNRLHLETGWVQDALGVGGRARSEGLMRKRRDPTQRPSSGEGGANKPMAKSRRAERESEGLVVPRIAADKAAGGKGPCFGRAGVRG